MNQRIVFIDTETAHKDPGPATIWELALILRDEGKPDRELVWHIRPDVSLADPAALRIGGYYKRCMVKAPFPVGAGQLIHSSDPDDMGEITDFVLIGADVSGYVARALDGAVIVGANAGSFDVPHLDGYLRAHGECVVADYHYLDIGSLVLGWAHGAGGWRGDWPFSLKDAINVCGLDGSAYTAHEALSDARAVRDIWDVVTGGPGR